MAQAETDSDYRLSEGLLPLFKSMGAVIGTLRRRRRTVATYGAIADLTPEQLKDVGLPEAMRPVLEVKAGLITNLMAMR
jgi:hypothetical protein